MPANVDIVRLESRNNVVTQRGAGVCLIPFDPAARNIPFGGKLKCTFAVVWIDIALFINVIIVNKGFEQIGTNMMIGPTAETLIFCGGMTRSSIVDGEVWRLLWSVFLHAGLIHLFVNMFAIVSLGRLIEPDWGTIRYATVFFVSSLSGNLLSCVLDDGVVSVGSSGGIYGILGGLVVFVLEYWNSIPLARSLFGAVGATCILALVTSFIPQVDIYAHLGGFFSGLLMSIVLCKSFTWKEPSDNGRALPSPPQEQKDPFGFPYLDSPRPQSGRIVVRVTTQAEDARPQSCSASRPGPTHFSYSNITSNIVINGRATRNSFRKTYNIDEIEVRSGHGLVSLRIAAAITLAIWWLIMLGLLFVYPDSYKPPGPIMKYGRQ